MSNRLNPPEKIIGNINGAVARIKKVDKILGDDLKNRFAKGVSRLLFHMENDKHAISYLKKDNKWGARFAIQIVNATAEFETAWYSLCLSNIPACYR